MTQDTDRISKEFAIIDTELKRRHDIDPSLSNTSVSAHLNIMSPEARELAHTFHDISQHGNGCSRMPFEKKVDPPDTNTVKPHVAAVHSRYETEQTIGGVATRMNTIGQNIEINRRESQTPPSIRDILSTQIQGD